MMISTNMNVQNADSSSTNFPWKWYLKDINQVQKNGKKVFSCFSCGGGSTMGYKIAGYDVVGCCELDPRMLKTYVINNHPQYPFLMDVREFVNIPNDKLPQELFDLDVLDGSPPCSVFSVAGVREKAWNVEKKFKEGQKEQRLDDLFLYFIDIAKKLQPKVVVAENVKGLLLGNAKGWINQIIKRFDDAGYLTQIFLFNSAKMGVPQKRERVFFIAHRKDLHYDKLIMNFNDRIIKFGDVREQEGKRYSDNSVTSELMKMRKPGDRCLGDISMRVRKKTTGFSSPINNDDEPIQTITAGGQLFRFCDGLLMTDKDIANCQTFPQDYDFNGESVQYVCGMSVPPVMMAKISEQVYKQWLKNG